MYAGNLARGWRNEIIKCSSLFDDTRFIYAALFPNCTTEQGPCRLLCENVRDGCLAILARINQNFRKFDQVGMQELDNLFNSDRLVTNENRIVYIYGKQTTHDMHG